MLRGILPLVLIPIAVLGLVALILIHELLHAVCYPRFGFTESTMIAFWPSKLLFLAINYDALPRNRLSSRVLDAVSGNLDLPDSPLLISWGEQWRFDACVSGQCHVLWRRPLLCLPDPHSSSQNCSFEKPRMVNLVERGGKIVDGHNGSAHY